MEVAEISAEMTRVRADFVGLVNGASRIDLDRLSDGTRWTNRQLLYHMVFGYLIVRTLMPLVHLLGRSGWSRRFAVVLNAGHRLFHLVNYLGSRVGGRVVPTAAMIVLLERTMAGLQRRLDQETEQSLALTMHFPTAWDPYFRPSMSVRDVYRYGTEHYEHHRCQLTVRFP